MYALEDYTSYWNPFTWFVTPRDATIEVLRRRQDRKAPIQPGSTLTQAEWSELFSEIRRVWVDEWGKDDPLVPRIVIETLRDYRITASGSPADMPADTPKDPWSLSAIPGIVLLAAGIGAYVLYRAVRK